MLEALKIIGHLNEVEGSAHNAKYSDLARQLEVVVPKSSADFKE